MSEVRKISSIEAIEELNLGEKSVRKLVSNNYSVQDIIIAARKQELTNLRGIGEKSAAEIFAAVDAAGFILHESEASKRTRDFLAKILQYQNNGADEYESQTEISEEQQEVVEEMLNTLTDRERWVLRLRFGLDGEVLINSTKDIGAHLSLSEGQVRAAEIKALLKMRHPSRMRRLMRAFPGFPGMPEPEPDYSHVLKELGLSRRAQRILGQAEIIEVEQLKNLSLGELLETPGMEKVRVLEIVSELCDFCSKQS